jgi:transcriptional regulator with PAS, ATPase and Fis domain
MQGDTRITIIAPSSEFEKMVQAMLKKMNLSMPSYNATGQETLSIAQQCISEGTKIIISRGLNVAILRRKFSIPIIEVPYTFEDIYYSYEEALKISDKIAFIGFDSARETAWRFSKISKNHLLIPELHIFEDMEQIIRQLKVDGVEVIIGGRTAKKYAELYGLHCIETLVSMESVQEAIHEAIHLRKVEKERMRNASMMDSILQATNRGLIAINETMEPLFINNLARQILMDKVDAFLETYKNSMSELTMAPIKDSLFNYIIRFENQSYTLDISPIYVDNTFFGSVISVENIETLISAEKEIRRKIAEKPYVAKKGFHDILGNSNEIQETIIKAKRYAKSDSTVLITGESGTGKEVFAQSIHNYSTRSKEPFVAINCAAIPENILESELFGYVKGAFTGARVEGKAGVFELAHGGTIFLDEIGEISKQVQVKLLRVLQEKEISRVGDTKTIPIDVRVIAATNKDLAKQIRKNKFRMDLFYRLCVLQLHLPPLKSRKEDIKPLVQSILSEYHQTVRLSEKALSELSRYEYPGNVRQLRNIVERLIVMSSDNYIEDTLVKKILESEPDLTKKKEKGFLISEESDKEEEAFSRYKAEKQMIIKCLKRNNGNKSKTAKELDISKSTLWRKLKQYELN